MLNTLRSNDLTLLYVYSAILNTLDIKKLLNDFILRDEIRKKQFAMEYLITFFIIFMCTDKKIYLKYIWICYDMNINIKFEK